MGGGARIAARSLTEPRASGSVKKPPDPRTANSPRQNLALGGAICDHRGPGRHFPTPSNDPFCGSGGFFTDPLASGKNRAVHGQGMALCYVRSLTKNQTRPTASKSDAATGTTLRGSFQINNAIAPIASNSAASTPLKKTVAPYPLPFKNRATQAP